MQNCGMPPPPFVSWAEALSTQRVGEDVCFWSAPNSGQIVGLNLSEDLFFALHLSLGKKIGLNLSEVLFFALHLILDRKIGLIFGGAIFYSGLCSSPIF